MNGKACQRSPIARFDVSDEAKIILFHLYDTCMGEIQGMSLIRTALYEKGSDSLGVILSEGELGNLLITIKAEERKYVISFTTKLGLLGVQKNMKHMPLCRRYGIVEVQTYLKIVPDSPSTPASLQS